jgi:hypothetical protein
MKRGRRGCDRMVVGFSNTSAISAYLAITTNIVSSNPAHGEMYLIQHYIFFGYLRQRVCDFSEYSGFSINKTDSHNITEILLWVALNTISQAKPSLWKLQSIKQIDYTILWLTSQTGWSLGNIHFSNNNGYLPFYVNLIYHRQDLCRTWLWATRWLSNKKQALLTLPSTWVRPCFFVGSLMVIFVLCFVTDVACVSGFTILDCHFSSL